jgi:hypothetical protein
MEVLNVGSILIIGSSVDIVIGSICELNGYSND